MAVKKKASAIKRDKVVEGAKKVEKKLAEGYAHPLMGVNINFLEISHRDIEKIEKQKYRIMADCDGDEAIQKYKDFIYEVLLEAKRR